VVAFKDVFMRNKPNFAKQSLRRQGSSRRLNPTIHQNKVQPKLSFYAKQTQFPGGKYVVRHYTTKTYKDGPLSETAKTNPNKTNFRF
jgi:hypothetical protein